MATYKIEISKELPGVSLLNGDNAILLEAEDATDARAMVLALTQNHEAAGAWANATVTLVPSGDVAPLVNPQRAEVQSFVCTVAIAGAGTNATFVETGAAGDTFSQMMDKLVVQLNAHADIAGAAWVSPTLTVSDIADNIGDHTVTCTYQFGGEELVSVVGAITDGGIAGATLEVAMSAGVNAPSAQFYQS